LSATILILFSYWNMFNKDTLYNTQTEGYRNNNVIALLATAKTANAKGGGVSVGLARQALKA
jgi:hypothetical protein